MKKKSPYLFAYAAFFILAAGVLTTCKKDEVIPDNTPPYYDEISDLLIENYIQRIYIDLIGREPLDVEMASERVFLKANDLSIQSRRDIVVKLQTDTNFIEGDSSYFHAYYNRMYNMTKVRMVEGASLAEINEILGPIENQARLDSITGNLVGYAEAMLIVNKLYKLIGAGILYRDSVIDLKGLHTIMVDNAVYDRINMNTFNFINATFDNLLFRFPTEQEFLTGFFMVEDNQPGLLFGESGQDKDEYIDILTNSREFYEGQIIWEYRTLLARDPTTQETENHMQTFFYDHNLCKVQEEIIISDEYAHFD